MIRPLGKRILVTRLEGHGIETVTKGGIILPATREASVRTKGDYFRARVKALSEGAMRECPDLHVGDDVLVYTYSGTAASVFTGSVAKGAGIFVEPDDILCAVDPIAEAAE